MKNHPIIDIVSPDASLPMAIECAQMLNRPIVATASSELFFSFKDQKPILNWVNQGQTMQFQHSFASDQFKRRGQDKSQHLLKAFKSKSYPIQSILDLTAGWCRDSFILAKQGYCVTAVEQSNIIYYLTSHSLTQQQDTLNLKLIHDNALNYLQHLHDSVDAIYIDPMFPHKAKKAKNQKELQFLQAITQNLNIESVFESALKKDVRRIVIKRPIHANFLADYQPSFQIEGKTIRFDIYRV